MQIYPRRKKAPSERNGEKNLKTDGEGQKKNRDIRRRLVYLSGHGEKVEDSNLVEAVTMHQDGAMQEKNSKLNGKIEKIIEFCQPSRISIAQLSSMQSMEDPRTEANTKSIAESKVF